MGKVDSFYRKCTGREQEIVSVVQAVHVRGSTVTWTAFNIPYSTRSNLIGKGSLVTEHYLNQEESQLRFSKSIIEKMSCMGSNVSFRRKSKRFKIFSSFLGKLQFSSNQLNISFTTRVCTFSGISHCSRAGGGRANSGSPLQWPSSL